MQSIQSDVQFCNKNPIEEVDPPDSQALWVAYYALKMIAVSAGRDQFYFDFRNWYQCIQSLNVFPALVERIKGQPFDSWLKSIEITSEDVKYCRKGFREVAEKLLAEERDAFVLACQDWLQCNLHPKQIRNNGVMQNLYLANELFSLSILEQELIRICFLREINRHFDRFFSEVKLGFCVEPDELLQYLGDILGDYNHWELRAAMTDASKLRALCLVCHSRGFCNMDDLIDAGSTLELLTRKIYANSFEMMSSVLPVAAQPKLAIDAFDYMSSDFQRALNWLRHGHQHQAKGINILLHGGHGTGKTEFARLVTSILGSFASELISSDEDGDSINVKKRMAGFNMAQIHLQQVQSSLLIVDEAEDVFPLRGRANWSNADYSKAWMNQLLENNPVPTIWISNDVSEMDPSYLHRFGLSIEFKIPPKAYRERWLRAAVADTPISNACIVALTTDDYLNVAHIEKIVRIAQVCSDTSDQIEQNVHEMIGSTRKLFGASSMPSLAKQDSDYCLELLNIEGMPDLNQLLNALSRKDKGRLCLYGVPGSGKTQLAQYIADQLSKPLHAKRASDLSSMWVGETEKNIAKAFEHAHAEGAILLLDECDSFLKDRAGAERNWQQTQTNEFLQQMERFEGIFIATTNFYKQLDAAILRRFQFKLNFLPMTIQQRLSALAHYFPNYAKNKLIEQALQQMDGLTPADFALVLEQAEWLGAFSDERIVELLHVELKTKKNVKSSKIGFL